MNRNQTILREAKPSDLPFMKKMLYEAVFWRPNPSKPSFEEGLALPDVQKALAGWGKRDGDTAVIATISSTPVGAAFFRFWTHAASHRGYVDDTTPVLVIGVQREYRRRGIGGRLIEWLIDRASRESVRRISLSVCTDNNALSLYRQHGFQELSRYDDTLYMVRTIP